MSAIVQMVRELVKAGLSGDDLLAAIDRVEASERGDASARGNRPRKSVSRRIRAPGEDCPFVARAIEYFGTQQGLADAIGVTRSAVGQTLHGHMQTSYDMAVAIERATDGAVSRSQLRPDLWPEGDKP